MNRLFIMANKSLPIFIMLHSFQSITPKTMEPFWVHFVFNNSNRYQKIHIMSTSTTNSLLFCQTYRLQSYNQWLNEILAVFHRDTSCRVGGASPTLPTCLGWGAPSKTFRHTPHFAKHSETHSKTFRQRVGVGTRFAKWGASGHPTRKAGLFF